VTFKGGNLVILRDFTMHKPKVFLLVAVILLSFISFASARQYWNPDLSGQDNFVNFRDYAVFAENWRKSGSGLAGDFDDNGTIDVNDLAYFTYYWLKEIHFEYVPNQLLVGFRPDVTPSTVEDLASSLNCSIIRKLRKRNVYLWKVKTLNNEQQVIDQLQTNPDVLYAERNGLAYPSGQKIPNDSSFNLQWNLHQTSNADINAPEGWYEIYNKFGRVGDPNIVIAIVDTGVDYNHPDLSARMWTDANGHHGYDFVNDDNYPMDDDGHGTHVAGIAAADTNNSTGVAGVSWGCRIMAVKVLPATGGGSWADIADGVDYAVDNGAKVINMSLDGTMSSSALENAIKDANDSKVVLVAAAGNSADYLNITKHYPACYDNVICVSATDSNDQYTSFTNYGSYVCVAAPGEDIYSTLPNNTYGYMSGTSMAAPHVSGLAAICLSTCSCLEPNDVKQYIQYGADDLGTFGKDIYYGWGRINIYRTVKSFIFDFNDLLAIHNNLSGNYVLCQDIDASASRYLDGGAGWTPIGTSSAPFTGNFNGTGHTITGLYINSSSISLYDGIGFFGNIYSSISTRIVIQDINLNSIDFNISGSPQGNIAIGGICGYGYSGVIKRSSASGNIVLGSITGLTKIAGGIVGYGYLVRTEACHSAVNIINNNPSTYCLIGSFVGYLLEGLIENCYSTGSVWSAFQGTGVPEVGGFVGRNQSGIINCYSTGAVTSNGSPYDAYIGGFCGQNTATITSCYYDTQASGQSDTGKGEPKTTSQMKQQATFVNWDFNDIWDINEGVSYPFLR
jgi:thermitase